MPIFLIIVIILIASIIISIFGFIKKIRTLKYIGIAGIIITVLLLAYILQIFR